MNKYFEETLQFAESLLTVDSSVLEEHHEEKGLFILFFILIIDNYDNSIQRLQLTSQIVYTYLLRLHIPLSPMSIEKYKKVLLIDEIDKADMEVENMLLEPLSDYSMSIPELGTISCELDNKPFFVLTLSLISFSIKE